MLAIILWHYATLDAIASGLTIFFSHLIHQALNNLGSVFADCGKLDSAADCYIKALKIQHTRAHQGLARVHFLKNDKAAPYKEMTNLIERPKNNASAYEKRSEYRDRELTIADLEMVTSLDPLWVYPYRYRAASLYFTCLLLLTFILINSNDSISHMQKNENIWSCSVKSYIRTLDDLLTFLLVNPWLDFIFFHVI